MTEQQTPTDATSVTDAAGIGMIPPEEARQRLEAAITPYIEEGWVVLVEHDYMARLHKGRRNLDFHVDLLGEVSVEEARLAANQQIYTLVLIVLIVAGTLITLALAYVLGYF